MAATNISQSENGVDGINTRAAEHSPKPVETLKAATVDSEAPEAIPKNPSQE